MFLSSFLTHKNPNRATRGRALESTRDATIANREHLSDYIEVRDELLTLGDQNDHVQGSLDDQFLDFFGVFMKFNYAFMFNRGLSVFDEPIGVLMRICCRIDVFLCQVCTLGIRILYKQHKNYVVVILFIPDMLAFQSCLFLFYYFFSHRSVYT